MLMEKTGPCLKLQLPCTCTVLFHNSVDPGSTELIHNFDFFISFSIHCHVRLTSKTCPVPYCRLTNTKLNLAKKKKESAIERDEPAETLLSLWRRPSFCGRPCMGGGGWGGCDGGSPWCGECGLWEYCVGGGEGRALLGRGCGCGAYSGRLLLGSSMSRYDQHTYTAVTVPPARTQGMEVGQLTRK